MAEPERGPREIDTGERVGALGSAVVDAARHMAAGEHETQHGAEQRVEEAARVTRSFALALERAGLPHIRFHDLRHAAATFLLAQGFTLEDVKNLLGHSSIVLTSNTYGHVLEQRQVQVAAGMDAALGG